MKENEEKIKEKKILGEMSSKHINNILKYYILLIRFTDIYFFSILSIRLLLLLVSCLYFPIVSPGIS
jgi:hypothetical protein